MTTKIASFVRAQVLRRDRFACIAPSIDPRAGECRDVWGNPIRVWPRRDRGPQYLQMSHTKGRGELAMSKKAESDPAHLVTLCPFHHTGTAGGSNWEARNRDKIRDWLTLRAMLT